MSRTATNPGRRDVLRGGATFAASAALAAPALAQADPGVRTGSYASSGPLGHSTNTHWIETPDGVFVVDGQWTLPFAREALARIRHEAGDKPLMGMAVTHDHTDHHGGMDAFVSAAREEGRGPFPIHASRQVRASLANDAQGFQANRAEQFGDDFGPVTTPTDVVEDGGAIDLGAVTLRVLERGVNEAPSTVLLHAEGVGPGAGAVICGDIVYDRRLPILREGFAGVENWLAQLAGLRGILGDALWHPGHGRNRAGSALIDEQARILRDCRDPTLEAVLRGGRLTAEAKAAITADLLERYGDWVPIVGLTHEEVLDLSLGWLAGSIDDQPAAG